MWIKFSAISLAFTASLFAVQAIIMYLWMYQHSVLFLIFLVGDIPLMMNFLLRRHETNSAISGGLQWFWYSLILTLKMVFLVWHKTFEASSHSTVVDKLPYTVFPSSIIPIVLFITPAIYILLSFRAAPQLYGSPIYVLSTESLLHSDLVTHVLLDLIDILVQMQHEQYPASLLLHSNWVYMYAGIVLTLVLFFHGLSFPTSGGEPTNSQRQGGDVYIVRKHAALVGIFLVDIPLLILRVYIWLHFPVFPGFNPWIMKNILFIPLQIVRLNQCRLAEKERSQKSQRESFFSNIIVRDDGRRGSSLIKRNVSSNIKTKNSQLVHNGHNSNNKANTIELSTLNTNKDDKSNMLNINISSNADGLVTSTDNVFTKSDLTNISNSSVDKNNNLSNEMSINGINNIINSKSDLATQELSILNNNFQRTLNMSVRKRFSNDEVIQLEQVYDDLQQTDSLNNLMNKNEQFNKELDSNVKKNFDYILKDIKSNRNIPPQNFTFFTIAKQLIYMFQKSGQSSYLSSILDNTLNVTQFQNIRLSLALIIPLISQITIAIVCRRPEEGVSSLQCDLNWFFPALQNNNDFSRVKCSAVFLSSAIFNFVSYYLVWFGMANFFDIICGSIYQTVIISSFYFVVHGIRNGQFIDSYFLNGKIDVVGVLVLLCVSPAVLTLLFNYFPLSSAFLGRKYLRFATPLSHKQWLINQISMNTDQKNNDVDNKSQQNPGNPIREDEVGHVNIGSCLLLLNCRYGIAPVGLNGLLIGPDTIKGIRTIDLLLATFYRDVLFIFITRGILLSLCFTWASLGIFLAHITFMIIYGIVSHTTRLLSLRRFELKILFQKILRDIIKDDSSSLLFFQQNQNIIFNYDQIYMNEDLKNLNMKKGFFKSNPTSPQHAELLQIIEQISIPYYSFQNIIKKYSTSGFFSSPGNVFLPYALGAIPL
ncbi:hypothetical protein FG386_002798 [Cryptosporidium ryanae]|uniref:uncharacterized protein n=1 Tax=Cryptosporidium ryanae TaxID=515981 RepID=UPI00351A74DE|nr:hypothetical protein FG386_002798 [Cryptosporidium ryanae]